MHQLPLVIDLCPTSGEQAYSAERKNTCPLAVPALEHELSQLKVGSVNELEAELELPTCPPGLNVERPSSIRLQDPGDNTDHVGDKKDHPTASEIELEVQMLRPRPYEERTCHVWFK